MEKMEVALLFSVVDKIIRKLTIFLVLSYIQKNSTRIHDNANLVQTWVTVS